MDRGAARHYIERDRFIFERIIFFEDMRFDFFIFLERIGAIMPDCPDERDMPEPPMEPLMEPPIWPDWARTGAERRARAAASKSVFFIGYSLDH